MNCLVIAASNSQTMQPQIAENGTADKIVDKKGKEGFMMQNKIGVTIVGLWLVAGLASAAMAGEADSGKALYEKSCMGCHGADGKGNEKMAKIPGFEKGLNIVGAETKKKSDEQLLKVIAEGAGKMPPSKLTKEEQKQALTYSRTLAK
jgi:mono/diheme cytochrome c family protein